MVKMLCAEEETADPEDLGSVVYTVHDLGVAVLGGGGGGGGGGEGLHN